MSTLVNDSDDDDDMTYSVVVNHEGQYSTWPAEEDPPPGWHTVGHAGSKTACLDYIEEVWTDMRPLSLRRQMEAGMGSIADGSIKR
jgi:MbtH protein